MRKFFEKVYLLLGGVPFQALAFRGLSSDLYIAQEASALRSYNGCRSLQLCDKISKKLKLLKKV